jgi:hypothetical protein
MGGNKNSYPGTLIGKPWLNSGMYNNLDGAPPPDVRYNLKSGQQKNAFLDPVTGGGLGALLGLAKAPSGHRLQGTARGAFRGGLMGAGAGLGSVLGAGAGVVGGTALGALGGAGSANLMGLDDPDPELADPSFRYHINHTENTGAGMDGSGVEEPLPLNELPDEKQQLKALMTATGGIGGGIGGGTAGAIGGATLGGLGGYSLGGKILGKPNWEKEKFTTKSLEQMEPTCFWASRCLRKSRRRRVQQN